jgi:DNA polymerase (family 10)
VRALDSGLITILAHPSGRLLGERDAYQVDYAKICDAARRNGVAIEINAHPYRLDLVDTEVKRASSLGVKLAIGTDAHSRDDLRFMRYGVAVARRGWCVKGDVLNCLGRSALEKALK